MANKIFKTLDEQIDILKSRGLVVNDYDKAKKILFKENYFFLNGYRHFFTANYKDENFIPGTTFEELYSMFTFDRKIRNIFFKNIDRYKYDDLVQKSIKETNIEKIIKINQRIKGKIKRILG